MTKRTRPLKSAPSALEVAVKKFSSDSTELVALRNWLLQQMTAQEYAKLGQGGHKNNQIPLRQVFIDLPVAIRPNPLGHPNERTRFLKGMLDSEPLYLADDSSPRKDAGNLVADSEAVSPGETVEPDSRLLAARRTFKSRFSATLLIGGPGQGKSTLGQLACQLHRAALLMPYLGHLSGSQLDLVSSFREAKQADSEEEEVFKLPPVPLLPLQVILPDLSEWLAAKDREAQATGEIPAIIEFLADQPGAREARLSAEVLYRFAHAIPILIVLDGFDEIGATQDRSRLVVAANELLSNLREAKAHVQVLATTRPQGYAGELSNLGIKLRPRYLVPLDKSEALEYASKLVKEKIPDLDLRQKTLSRLYEAAEEPATQRLLTTPLQVTILTALVQQLGRAPRERWNLFSRYFSYTYDREIERGTYASRLLAEYRSHIEKIHARVGLLLQVEAERDGGASARMSRQFLEEVIREVLSEDEIADDVLQDLVKDIAAAAEQRLVFLVEPEPNRFGFEIRSLQEFMAAWAITSGRDSELEVRLTQLAKAPMFRNVVLFIASKLFSEGSPLRDFLASNVCRGMDEDSSDAPSRVTMAGSILALETLEEGAVLAQPKRARALVQCAAQLVTLPPNNEHLRLAQVLNTDTISAFQQTLEHLESPSNSSRSYDSISVCATLAILTNSGDSWARSMLVRVWSTLKDRSVVLQACRDLDIAISRDLAAIAEQMLSDAGINFSALLSFPDPAKEGPGALLPWIAGSFDGEPWEHSSWQVSTFTGHILIPSTLPETVDKSLLERWCVWIGIANFQYFPSAASLASVLELIADKGIFEDVKSVAWCVYWPLATCIFLANDAKDFRIFAEELRAGTLGDIEDWKNAEKEWRKSYRWDGRMAELLSAVPWSKKSLQYAPPFWSPNTWRFVAVPAGTPASRIMGRLTHVNTAFLNSGDRRVRDLLASSALYLLHQLPNSADVTEFPVQDWMKETNVSLRELSRRPPSIDPLQWRKLIQETEIGVSYGGYFERFEFYRLLASNEITDHLLNIAVTYIHLHTTVGRRAEPESKSRESAIASLKNFRPTSPLARSNCAVVRIFLGDVLESEVDDLLSEISANESFTERDWDLLIPVARAAAAAGSCPSSLLVKTFELLHSRYPQSARAVDLLRDELQSRKSGLQNPVNWNRLGFPLPTPIASRPEKSMGIRPAHPISIESLKLQEVRGIESLNLRLAKPEEGRGQWIVVIGRNGVGKTTLLRSVVLSLRDTKNPAIWPKGAFSTGWNRISSVSSSQVGESKIEVRLTSGQTFNCTVRGGHGVVVSQSPQFLMPSEFPIFAYGCRRGSALGGAAREVNLGSDDGPEVATLFDDSASLIHAETWIIQLEGNAQKNRDAFDLYMAVLDSLKQLLNISDIGVHDKRVWVREHGGPSLPFTSLSDGYLTSAGWFVDLIARWIELCERNGVDVPRDFLRQMKGLVLIDEIDLHLHPRWQIEIITRTKKLLPQMSFIVTTHNPLTLVGARAEEIWVLTSDERTGGISCQQGLENPMLLTGGQLYRRYFGIEDVYPDHLGRALQRYSFLSGYVERNDAEEKELCELIDVLEHAGVRPQWEIVERAKSVS